MKATKRILIKCGVEDLLRRLNYNGEIPDTLFATLKKEGGPFFHIRMWKRIFQREDKTFLSLSNPHELKMNYSPRWNQISFRIPAGSYLWNNKDLYTSFLVWGNGINSGSISGKALILFRLIGRLRRRLNRRLNRRLK